MKKKLFNIKELYKQYRLYKAQYKHLKAMMNELNEYINWTNDNPEDIIDVVSEKLETINEFSANLGVKIDLGDVE